MKHVILVSIGGAIGAALRYGLVGLVVACTSAAWVPVGTLLCNALGCFVLGYLVATSQQYTTAVSAEAISLFGVGVCGAFTTFSAFGVDAMSLYRQESMVTSLGYIAGSVVLGVGMVVLGGVVAAGVK